VLGAFAQVLFGLLGALRLASTSLLDWPQRGILVLGGAPADLARLGGGRLGLALGLAVEWVSVGHSDACSPNLPGRNPLHRVPGRSNRNEEEGMTVAVIVGVCVLLLVLAFLLPRLSRGPQRGVDATLGVGQRAGGKAPGPLGRLFSKSFGTSRKATNRSAGAGRRGRGKLPL
jgi:Family of unknown function (DUF6411)